MDSHWGEFLDYDGYSLWPHIADSRAFSPARYLR